MDLIRSLVEGFYDATKSTVLKLTDHDPQKAHELFILFCKTLHKGRLERLALDNRTNRSHPLFELSNAAGFNKNGDIPPTVLNYLGFDRVVVGTVTNDPWKGNPRPTIRRYPATESIVNWMGLPGDGAEAVAESLAAYGNHKVPITINFMSTPGKQGDQVLRDLEGTITSTRDLPYIDRFELNISCPNTHTQGGTIDARKENIRMLGAMLETVEKYVLPSQEIYLKVSPDSTQADVDDTIEVMKHYKVNGIVTANTSTNHDLRYIPISPKVNGSQVGGASGNAVYDASLKTQILYEGKRSEKGHNWKLIASGGINSLERLKERLENGAEGIQIFTPLIFSGLQLLRKLRMYKR